MMEREAEFGRRGMLPFRLASGDEGKAWRTAQESQEQLHCASPSSANGDGIYHRKGVMRIFKEILEGIRI
jgi:hypothetical protein